MTERSDILDFDLNIGRMCIVIKLSWYVTINLQTFSSLFHELSKKLKKNLLGIQSTSILRYISIQGMNSNNLKMFFPFLLYYL